MKRFVAIVLRGLVSLSKEHPIWAKEHHRLPNKEHRKKRMAVKGAKNTQRRNFVRAVSILHKSTVGRWLSGVSVIKVGILCKSVCVCIRVQHMCAAVIRFMCPFVFCAFSGSV